MNETYLLRARTVTVSGHLYWDGDRWTCTWSSKHGPAPGKVVFTTEAEALAARPPGQKVMRDGYDVVRRDPDGTETVVAERPR